MHSASATRLVSIIPGTADLVTLRCGDDRAQATWRSV